MASFADLVKAQRQSGKSVLTSLSGAYNQQQMQKFDVRNKLFADSGVMTALFPGLKGYKAQPISAKDRALTSPMPLSQVGSTSPSLSKAVARDLRISARNSMVLPSIARNMATLVTIWGGKAAKVPKGYTEAPGGGAGAKKPPGKSGGGSSMFGGIASGIGGMLGGVGNVLGSMVGSLGSVIGSILGGVGSLLGGAASGIMGILGGALSGMGLWGVLIAGVAGFALYSIFKGVDFSSLGKGIGGVMESIQSALSGLFNDLDDMSGGKLGEFIKWTKNTIKGAIDRIGAGIETAMELFSELGTAVLLDMKGFFTNFFQENKGKIFALMAIGLMGPRALLTLPGAAIATIAGLVGAATGERSIDELKSENESLKKEYERRKKEGRQEPTYDIMGNVTGTKTVGDQLSDIEDKIKENERQIAEKEARTSNVNQYTSGTSLDSISEKYQQKLAARQGTSPTAAGGTASPNAYKILELIGSKEGGKAGYDAINKGKAGDTPGGYPGLSKLTVGEVMALQANKKIFAAGKYQFIPKTLAGLVAQGIVKKEDVFSPVIQDKLAMHQINMRIKAGKGDPTEIQKQLAMEFASIADPSTGKSYYEGKAGNKASISTAQIQSVIGGDTQVASAGTPTPATPAPTTAKSTSSSISDTVASLASDQVKALDRMMGGKLLGGSTELADMLRDITKEFMNNPIYDNSTTVNNNNVNGGSSVTASTYDSDILKAIMERKVWNA